MSDSTINAFTKGTWNLADDENIPKDSAQSSSNWITQDGRLRLVGGRLLIGAEGLTGKISGLNYGYKVDGTKVLYRKVSTKIQYLNSSDVWTDCVTGLTADSEYTFSNYSSLAGAFTIATGIDGIWKFVNTHPTNPINLTNIVKNFKGYSMIDKGRMFLWNRPEDKTGLYGSYIDRQKVGTNYIQVTGEATAAATSGTLVAMDYIITVTIAAPAVVTWNNHQLLVGNPVVFATTGALPTGITAGTTYYVSEVVDANSFKIATTSGGSSLTTSGSQSGVHTLTSPRYRNCFGLTITITATGQVFTDNYLGVLTGSLGGTGTINYVTGAWTLSTSSAGVAKYIWENSTYKGIADFTQSGTRLASEGFQFPQDIGGDAIQNVLVGLDGKYYSLKSSSAYWLSLPEDDITATQTVNEVYRRELGLPYFRAAVSTKKGIVFMNTANPGKPELTILKRNDIGTDIEPYSMFPQFKFSNYDYSDCTIDNWDRYIIISCKSEGSLINDVVLLCDTITDTVDETKYGARMFAKTEDFLYVGSPVSESVYQIYSGFDDDSDYILNEWISKGEQYEALGIAESLKKFKKVRIKGNIDPDQSLQVLISYDGDDFSLVGTVVGNGSYVDYTSPESIGSNVIGSTQLGGSDLTTVYPFFAELKLTAIPKFRKRTIKLVAAGIGYVDVDYLMDRDILIFEKRIPKRFRSKQNVSLDGTQTDQ